MKQIFHFTINQTPQRNIYCLKNIQKVKREVIKSNTKLNIFVESMIVGWQTNKGSLQCLAIEQVNWLIEFFTSQERDG